MLEKLSDNRFTRPIKQSVVRTIAANGPRSLLNRYYDSLDDNAKSRFHARYSGIFRHHDAKLTPGEWRIRFANRTIRLPLRPEWSWLDWETAISIIGHDIEIKQTYAALVQSASDRPMLFIDVGANYGTHSILFLAAKIPILAFEPNDVCLSYFKMVCDMNGFSGSREPIAIGNKAGEIELSYPENETWLGSVSSGVASRLKGKVIHKRVPLQRLDDYLDDMPDHNILIKIDVEGFEREVLEGATKILETRKPKLIFESNDVNSRGDLYRLLAKWGYRVFELPWRPDRTLKSLDANQLAMSRESNFIAIVGG